MFSHETGHRREGWYYVTWEGDDEREKKDDTREFKSEAVRLLERTDESGEQIANGLGI